VIVWLVTVVAGLIVIAASLLLARQARCDVLAAGVLVIGGAAANCYVLRLPSAREHHRQETSVASAVYVTAFLLLPPAAAVLVATLSYGLVWVLRPRQRPWFKNLFNVCQYAVAVGLAGVVWNVGGGGAEGAVTPARLAWLVAAILEYFVVNTGAVATIVATAERLPVFHVWLLGNRHTLPAYFGTIFVGLLLAELWTVAPWTVALAAVPLVAIYFAFKSTVELEEQTRAALFQLAEIIDQRDYYTHKHSLRVGEYSERIALELKLPADQAYLVHLAGRLHDIGKCAVNNEVLLKPGPLTAEEREHMARHPVAGGLMLQHFTMFRDVARWVRAHHESFDGTGYPDGLAGEQIPLGARIISVADAYDAMTTTRPYRVGLPHEEAVRRLLAGRGTQWDPRVIDTFLRLFAEQRIRSYASATAGEQVLRSA